MNSSNVNDSQDTSARKALGNVTLAIEMQRHFPDQVFRGIWNEFFFFDSDEIFDGDFVERAKLLLRIEGATCACISNFDLPPDSERYSYFIDATQTGHDYATFLSSPNAQEAWIYGVDRFGSASDTGQWAIYCEKRNEMAVMAIRNINTIEKYRPVLSALKAVPINEAISKPLSYGFSSHGLSDEWKSKLIERYAKRVG